MDQITEQKYRAVAISRLIRKLDRKLIPFLVLEITSYINRLSIGVYVSPLNSTINQCYAHRSRQIDEYKRSITDVIIRFWLGYISILSFLCESIERMQFKVFSCASISISVNLRNSKHTSSTHYWTDSVSIVECDSVGFCDYWNGFCQGCATNSHYQGSSCKLIELCQMRQERG